MMFAVPAFFAVPQGLAICISTIMLSACFVVFRYVSIADPAIGFRILCRYFQRCPDSIRG